MINDKNTFNFSSSREKRCWFSQGGVLDFLGAALTPRTPLYSSCELQANSRTLVALFPSPGLAMERKERLLDDIDSWMFSYFCTCVSSFVCLSILCVLSVYTLHALCSPFVEQAKSKRRANEEETKSEPRATEEQTKSKRGANEEQTTTKRRANKEQTKSKRRAAIQANQ